MNKKILSAAVFIHMFFLFFLMSSCAKEAADMGVKINSYSGASHFELVAGSIEKIFSSQMPWELRLLNHFNVIKKDSDYCMWYESFGYNQTDFDGSFCYANSQNGDTWNRFIINNNTNIVIPGNNETGVMGECVFMDIDDKEFPYKMICTKLSGGKQQTFLYTSGNGINWKVVKKLYSAVQDTQFGVISFNNLYYVFSRYNDYSQGYQRAIGLSVLDKDLNTIQPPRLLIKADANSSYPHIYNNAASKINDSTFLLFPTYYDDKSKAIRIKMIYTNNLKDYYLVDDNLNDELFPDRHVNWALVSPGVVAADEKNTYWLYYSGTLAKHDDLSHATKIDVTYYRIKLKIS